MVCNFCLIEGYVMDSSACVVGINVFPPSRFLKTKSVWWVSGDLGQAKEFWFVWPESYPKTIIIF